MEFSIKSTSPDKHKTACAVAGVYQQRKLTPAARALDQAAGGVLSKLLRRGDCDGKAGSTLLVQAPAGLHCERILLVGLGKENEVADKDYRDAVRAAVKAVSGTGASEASSYLAEVKVGQRGLDWKIEQAVMAAGETLYRFDELKSEKDDAKPALRKVTLMVTAGETRTAEAASARSQAIVKAMNLAKDLGNLPGNICTPTYLADQARAVAKASGLKIQVLEQKDIEKLGMGSFLSVAKGSEQPPKFIVMQYHGGAKGAKPVVLVGKGITFDSGGISLKPGAEMDEMKYDMCGAASVLGSMQALAELGLALNVVGLIPTCENLPSGRANKPGDIVTSMSGQTIEVLNTDAEGRLILCDALTYAERFDPVAVVDVATLTGACVIALGHVVSGLLANDDALARELLQAGEASGDRCWQLPLLDDYQEQLKSNFADMANIGGRPAGTITASAFLSRFAKKYKWAHLDIAGTAWKSGKGKGGTGRPVPLLVHFLAGRSQGS
ncbi:MAG: leucyl aminopeptidase [Hydrogenophilales bacterium CG03_land_8_20_14_0_80_62_28]|nr:leucyl aminopeptidase [Betaproteobacteria bacterium]OIO79944.1 MAG: leucyl aminopeptidase [Hydrogenophilaceae bacterium CG1_02_62_390]PIV23138.1 MAG: leucyl aminopeptidase [Hydrogenophilales bacterium CG03_land_8_20_14_0_80_62_28]PIW38658.1 MAG: leucyl aminopeptidase [Hydrogenophilales bacterium CG15_BIG_FIL_POST_REV_8_21_14_020_62_31]PIW72262.1 MAG: leucyl aminopeptidase [Hydrogenophilales bacterium CG12_big_fil_rev_8_21_14_0_65_61_21]PIX00891.1 MAG: leucyl aminopeptidase [Hydrogenophilale